MDETTQVAPAPAPTPTPTPSSGTNSNKTNVVAVIEAVVIILLIFTSALGWYMYGQKANSPAPVVNQPIANPTGVNTYQNPFDASQSALPAYQNPFATQ